MDWTPITDTEPVEGQIVETQIDDGRGPRNQAVLVRRLRFPRRQPFMTCAICRQETTGSRGPASGVPAPVLSAVR